MADGTRNLPSATPSASENDEDDEEDEEGKLTCLQVFEHSNIFQFTVIGMILLNTLLMAAEADGYKDFEYLDDFFLIFFVVEISFRLAIYRCSFFTREGEWSWNVFDLVIVLCGVLGSKFVTQQIGRIPRFNTIIFRVLRILRVLRAFRLFRQFKKLRILGQGLIDSLQSVVWVALLFLLVIFTYAILITSIAGKNLDMFDEEDREVVDLKFGTVLRSMETLFLFLTLDDWSTPARIVNKQYPWMEIVWITYLVIGAFTLLSLLTGLMAEKMNQVRTAEEEQDQKEQVIGLDKFLDRLKKIFLQADTSGDAKMSLDEFRLLVAEHSHEMHEWGVPNLKEGEIDSVFYALDNTRDGSLTWDEFREGILRLSRSRPYTNKDIMWLEASISKLDRALRARQEDNPGVQWGQRLHRIHARASLMYERVADLETTLQKFFKEVGYRSE